MKLTDNLHKTHDIMMLLLPMLEKLVNDLPEGEDKEQGLARCTEYRDKKTQFLAEIDTIERLEKALGSERLADWNPKLEIVTKQDGAK